MTSWSDHLTSVLIGGGVLVLLASLWDRGQTVQVSATTAYQARTTLEAVRATLDRDMAAVGVDVPLDEDAVLGWAWTGPTRSFEFRGRLDAPAGDPPDQVRYVSTQQTCASGSGTCWRLQRQVHDGTVYRDTAFDIEAVHAEVQMLPAGGGPAAATSAHVRIVLPEVPGTPAGRGFPLTIDRHYRLVNQALRHP